MSVSRHIPVQQQTVPPASRQLWPHIHQADFPPGGDPFGSSFRELAIREPLAMEPVYRDYFNNHNLAGYGAGGPLSRSFFNPERQLSTMDGEMQRMAVEMRRMFTDMQHLMPADANPESWRIKENFLLDNPIHQDRATGQRMFRLQFDVRQFKPDEIVVNTAGNQLTIHAKHEEKSDGKSLNREYHRQYVLPKDLNAENLVSKLNRDGVLLVEAPLPALEGGTKERLIPIKHN